MRPCAALRGSTAIHSPSRILRTQWQPYSSRAEASQQESPVATAADDQTPAAPFHVDHESKTIKTAVGDLPLSPVMDPTFWEARDRFKKMKPKPGKPHNVFEREFRKNPFAQALATPVRHDMTTQTRLPSFFFQDFKLITHPETGKPWWVPRSLALHEPPTATESPEYSENMGEPAEKDTGVTGSDDVAPKATAAATGLIPKPGSAFAPSGYVLARQDLIKSVLDRKSRNFNLHRRLLAQTSTRHKPVGGAAVWREDMDTLILDQMRRQIVQNVLYLSRMCETANRYYIVRCFGWDDIKFKHRGAVLWFGREAGEETGNDVVKPGRFATYDFETSGGAAKTSVLVHNMPMLLGDQYSEQLRREAGVFKEGSLFMLAGRRTTDLQLMLWKLQGYLSDSSKS
ncbi:hypothetical protein JX266_002357 [Neoarthrinium moseri]|nr:hypothetical protein JX266_002357 [Neoarthrinium moseri]